MSDWDNSDFEPDVPAPVVVNITRRFADEVQQPKTTTEIVISDSDSDDQDDELISSVPNETRTNVICEGRHMIHGTAPKVPSLEGYLRKIIMCKRFFPMNYLNIIDEFADVEIFLISLDSLIVECLDHKYHNRSLGSGQSLVLCHQVDRYLDKLTSVGGKFKLIVFTDLNEIFQSDNHLDLSRTIVIEHITQGLYGNDLAFFMSPHDPAWVKFLKDMTPSFIMISMENPTFSPAVRLATHFATIMWNCLTMLLPVVLFNSLSINFKTVMAYRLTGNYYRFPEELEKRTEELWKNECIALNTIKFPPTNINSICDLWINIISETKNTQLISADFDILASAILLSALFGAKQKTKRVYLPEIKVKEPSLTLNSDCEKITRHAKFTLQLMDCKNLSFSLKDLWDGRMILSFFEYIKEDQAVLPADLQEEYESYRTNAEIDLVLPIYTNSSQLTTRPKRIRNRNPIPNKIVFYPVKFTLLDDYVIDFNIELPVTEQQTSGYASWLLTHASWSFGGIPETFKPEVVFKTDWQRCKENKNRQKQMRWFEMFATSLEGRGNLQVDFTRTTSFEAMSTEDTTKTKKGWAGQKGNNGKKKNTANKVKDIRDANLKAKEQKIIQDERLKINHALQQGHQAVSFLEKLLDNLQTAECKAICIFEMAKHEAARIIQEYQGTDPGQLEQMRANCVILVGYLKECFVNEWKLLDERQKQDVVDLWATLGFKAPTGFMSPTNNVVKKLDLNMDLVYYLMEYGGQLVDIQSDPIKDSRVTGFAPDAWQRKMLDTVDEGNSALIVAPTSAGKTFVSYYCMEKILRTSDSDVVVFVSPEKALMNQVCGSVYGRFKTKVMAKGKAQFGILHPDYNLNPLNCQILVTVAECLEHLLLSTDPDVQEFVAKVRYVIFDEVHSIGVSDDSHMWEHLFLLIRCPFLALSATVGNILKLHEWMENLEREKTGGKRKVDLIQYNERYSELELSIINIEDPTYGKDVENTDPIANGNLVQPLMPYGVYALEKLQIFGIPDDQQLTAKQILHLYKVMARLDDTIRETCEPNSFFGNKENNFGWISRSHLRELENKLKETFLDWVNTDKKKIEKVLKNLKTSTISKQIDYRSSVFLSEQVAEQYIYPLVDELQNKKMLPAICFNDDSDVCENLAKKVVEILKKREEVYMETDEYKNLDNIITRDDSKLSRAAKKQRAEDDKYRKGKAQKEEESKIKSETVDPLEREKAMKTAALERFKLKSLNKRDQDLYRKAIERLSKGNERDSTRLLLTLIERGVAFHHARMTSNEKQAVEILFRAGYLAVLFSTKTLALGVNMPCKTVIFGIDTFFLTPLVYRQMSGRAGRRGFDHKGNVIFMGVPTKKMRRLLTASLPNLEGNPPFDTTFILRLLAYVDQKNEKGIQTTTEERNKVALSVLNNYFSLYTRREAIDDTLQKQLRLYFAYSVQFLRHLQLIDENCIPQNLSSLCCVLHKFAPGNFVFVHLLQKGVFHRMCNQHNNDPTTLKYKLLVLLATIFTRIRMPPTYVPGQRTGEVGDRSRCLVHLPDFSSEIRKHIDDYNTTATMMYEQIMKSVGSKVTDPIFDITGSSATLFGTEHLVSPIFEKYSHDDSFVPILAFRNKDYRGKKIYYNAFAVDLYLYHERSMLSGVHHLQTHGMWYNIHDFVQVLRLLSTGLSSLATPNDPLYLVIQSLYEEYKSIFEDVFEMKKRS